MISTLRQYVKLKEETKKKGLSNRERTKICKKCKHKFLPIKDENICLCCK